MSAPADEPPLGEHLRPLEERLQRKRDRAKLVRRHDLPQAHGQLRPWGLPAVADTLLQLAVTRLLTAIDEQEFRRGREGYRPHMGALDAGDKLTIKLPCGRDHGVVEAEITGFFDHIKHAWMIRMLAERIDDQARRWVIKKWLNAGGLDTDGQVLHPVTGTPQGGIIAPIFATVYLHDALDWWVEPGGTRRWRGEACLIRYADDCVCAFEKQEAAERFDKALGQRLGTCGLELSAEKTRVLSCSRQPPVAKTSFEFLGFECRGGKNRAGKDHLNRRTSRTKLRNSLKRFTQWCKTNRHQRRGVLCARLNAKLRGYDHDDGVHGNCASLTQCCFSAMGILQQWRNRRRPRRRYPWAGDTERLARVQVERPRMVGRPQTRWAASRVEAGWRTRVCLKSPLRDHRPPGSVRGPSGHWRSYRDDACGTEGLYYPRTVIYTLAPKSVLGPLLPPPRALGRSFLLGTARWSVCGKISCWGLLKRLPYVGLSEGLFEKRVTVLADLPQGGIKGVRL